MHIAFRVWILYCGTFKLLVDANLSHISDRIASILDSDQGVPEPVSIQDQDDGELDDWNDSESNNENSAVQPNGNPPAIKVLEPVSVQDPEGRACVL